MQGLHLATNNHTQDNKVVIISCLCFDLSVVVMYLGMRYEKYMFLVLNPAFREFSG